MLVFLHLPQFVSATNVTDIAFADVLALGNFRQETGRLTRAESAAAARKGAKLCIQSAEPAAAS